MKRLLLAMLAVIPALPAVALDPSPSVVKIGVLRGEADIERTVARELTRELRERGFDAFDARRTYDEAVQDGAAVADVYVEVVGGSSAEDFGGIGVGGVHAEASLAILVARVTGEVRIYDGETLEMIAGGPVERKSTALVPTGVGFGSRAFFAWLAVPVAERLQMRRVVRAAARQAALVVARNVR
jgi:hypothetical protein